MSAKPETTFTNSVHKYLPLSVYHMKNHNPYVGGVPDVWYSGTLGDLWVEYKFITMPKRMDTFIPIDLSKLQKEWLRSRHAEGRSVAVIIGHKDGGVWLPGVEWDDKFNVLEFLRLNQTRQQLATIIERSVQ